MQSRPTRRSFLTATGTVLAGLAAACTPATASPPPAQSPASGAPAASGGQAAWEREWDDLVTAARKEGKLVVLTNVGTEYRKVMDAFEQAFPGITVDQTGMVASQAVPRILQERKG